MNRRMFNIFTALCLATIMAITYFCLTGTHFDSFIFYALWWNVTPERAISIQFHAKNSTEALEMLRTQR